MAIGGFPKNAGRFAHRPTPVVEISPAALSPTIDAEPAEIDYSDYGDDTEIDVASGDVASVKTLLAARAAGATIDAEPAEIDYSDYGDDDEPETDSGSDGAGSDEDEASAVEPPEDPDEAPVRTEPLRPLPRPEATMVPVMWPAIDPRTGRWLSVPAGMTLDEFLQQEKQKQQQAPVKRPKFLPRG